MTERSHLLNPPAPEASGDRIESLLRPILGRFFLLDDREKEGQRDLVRSIDASENWAQAVA